ncbi:MAG: ATP-dependent RNA helicase RhlE [Syntrophaceae bacterium PtaU1.Bin231]|nr:MAG: ATP-dependent RNA helicase RhlE [Syntrophaceae bacterium PtaU1.Bin231]HOG16811.1 DEAD/DEAH box helicase [Syntrophales bacterium]
MSFRSFHLHPDIENGIEAMGYTEPTPIQRECIPVVLQNHDVMGLAQTGTGKTAAFVLPILQRLMTGPRRVIRALIIAPTRELAEQIHDHTMQLGRRAKIKSLTIYGGVGKNPQITKLRSGAEIVVACPGRLLDLMNEGEIDVSRVEVLVLDEADRMFDMGFLPDIRRIVGKLPKRRQTLLFSATMPEDIRQLAQEVLQNPLTIRIDDTIPLSTVSHALFPVEPHRKTALLMKLLDRTDTESVLVFTRTKHRATRLAQQMKKAGYPVASLQGDLPQNKRKAALNGFRDGRYRILVATDIAARGIDVSSISHVINYDMPDTAEAYTHRIGRTGRAAKTGDAFTFVTREDRAFVWTIEKVLGEAIERRTLADFDYTAPPPAGSGFDRLRRSGGGPAIQRREDALPAVAAASPWGGSRDSFRKATKIFSSSNLRSRRPRGAR